MLALVVTCFAIAVVGHGGSDEHDGRTEQVLATATSRSRAFVATLLVALVGVDLAAAGHGVAVALGVRQRHRPLRSAGWWPRRSRRHPRSGWWPRSPSLLYTLRSRWAVLGWGFAGAVPDPRPARRAAELPSWVIDLSPYMHVPRMPVEAFELGPVVVLTAIAAGCWSGRWLRFRTRDIG